MKLLLIGHSVEDHIFYKGEEKIKPGGLYYSAAGMLNIKDDKDEVILLTSIDKKCYHLFRNVYNHLNITYATYGDGIVPRVNLYLYDDREREEQFDRTGIRLKLPDSIPFSPDGILINMISGTDINPSQLAVLRKKYNCPFYMDVHSLSRVMGPSVRRSQKLIENFDIWAENLDIIQVNDFELFSLYDSKSEFYIARRVIEAGVKCLIVTKGEKGARIYYKERNEIASVFYSALKVIVKNTVGCGDIFGAVFFYTFIKFGDIIKSLGLANKAAGILASYVNADDLSKLKDDVFARHN